MNNGINSGSLWRAFAALLLTGAVILSAMALAASSSDSPGPGSGNAGGGYVGSGTSGGPSPSGNAGGGGGSGGCQVINGPVKFVPIYTTTETRRVKVGSDNSNSPGDTYLIQERTVTTGEYQMTVYTTCTCDNTHQRETTSSTTVKGTDTRYSSWKTVSVERG